MSNFCKNCGAELKPDIKLCTSCGADFIASSEQPATEAISANQNGNKATDAKKRKMPPKKFLIPAIAIVLVLAICVGFLPRLMGGGKYPYEKGATVEATVKAGEDTKIGNIKKTGWELLIPDGVMKQDTAVTMKVLSSDESKKYQSSDFTLYGTPIEVSGDGAHGIWFAAPTRVTIKIPKEYLKDLASEEIFFATYFDGEWRYFMPDQVNMKDGTAILNASHFSLLGFGKPSEDEQIKTFAQTYAADEYNRQQEKKKLNDAVGKQLDNLFKSIGIDSTVARDQLVKDAVAYLESAAYDELLDDSNPVKDFAPVDTLVRMAGAAQAGKDGKQEFNDKAIELYTKAIAFGVEKSVNANKTFYGVKDAQTGYVDKTAKAIAVLGGLGTAAGAFAGGDTKAGFEAVGNMLTGLAGPKAQLLVSTLNYAKEGLEQAADEAQAYWTQAEIEEAYKIYINQASGLEGDFESIFSLKGNAEALMNIRIIKAHCEKYGINEDDLGSASRDAVIKGAWKGLRNYFEERKIAEPEIAKLRQNEEAFIAELKKQGLLSYYDHQKYFGIDKNGSNYDVATRLQRLYAIRDAVLSCIDPDKRADLDNQRLVRAISVWITKSEKNDKEGFFKYLRETGLYEESFKTDATFEWVLTKTVNYDRKKEIDEKNKNCAGVYSYSASSAPGSYSYTWTYLGDTDNYYDPPTLNGENSTSKCTWTVPPSTIQGGEKVTLSFELSFGSQKLSFFSDKATADADFDKWDVSPGSVTDNSIRFANKDGKTSFTIDTYKTVKIYSLSETVTAVAPTGRKKGDKIALRTCFNGIAQGTCYIYEWKQAG